MCYVIRVLLKIQVLFQIKKLPKISSGIFALHTILVLNIIPDTRHLILMNACKFCDPNQSKGLLGVNTCLETFVGIDTLIYGLPGSTDLHGIPVSTYLQFSVRSQSQLRSQVTSQSDWCDDPPACQARFANKHQMTAEPGEP